MACDEAGVSGNRFTELTLADVEAQYQSLVGQAKAAVGHLEVHAHQDELACAFADAAAAFVAWYDAQRAAYTRALSSDSRSEQLMELQSNLGEGQTLLATAEAADTAATEAGVVVNPMTDLRVEALTARHRTLSETLDAALERVAHEAEQDAKKRTFAAAAGAFVESVRASTAALEGAAELSGHGGQVEQLRGAVRRIETAQAEAERSGQPLYEAAVAAGQVLVSAGLTGEPLTRENVDTLGLAWAELQDLGRTLAGKAKQALSEAERLAKTAAEKRAEVRKSFDSFDKDKSGTLGLDEFKGALKALGEAFEDEEAAALFATLDRDSSGDIGFDEFLDYMTQRDSGGFDHDSLLNAFRTVCGDQQARSVGKDALVGALDGEAAEIVDTVLFGDGEGELDIVRWCGEPVWV